MQSLQLTQRILNMISECASNVSHFQRSVAMSVRDPIVPGDALSSSPIQSFACFGIAGNALEQTQQQLSNGTVLSGEPYSNRFRIGRCYYFPAAQVPPIAGLMAPSRRRYMSPNGWSHGDMFAIPFWQDGRMIGQALLDDPGTGALPSSNERARLEEIANIAALALRDARELETLNREHGLLRFLADYAMAGLLVVQRDVIRYANDQIVNILGYEKKYLSTLTPWWNFLHPDDRPLVWDLAPGEVRAPSRLRAIRRDGRVIWLSMTMHSVLYADDTATAFQFVDVSDRIQAEELLKEKALRDPLTGFRNRGYFDDAIQIEVERSKRYKREFTLMMADLTNFKQVNDRLGHQEGDRVLAGLAGILQDALRDSDWVVRYGGDEFLLVLPETGASVDSLVHRLSNNVDQWCAEHCPEVPLSIDFGWSTWRPDDAKPVADMIRMADEMLYRHKRARQQRQNKSVSASADSGGSDTR